MLRIGKTLLAVALVAALGGCEAGVRKDAAKGAERLFAAVVARDRVAFEAAVDRRAVREDLRGQLIEVAREQGLEVDGGPSEFALDRMIGPEAFRLVDERGERLAQAPNAEQIAGMIEVQDRQRACVQDKAERCLLTFAKQKAEDGPQWRLVGMVANDLIIRVPETDTPGVTARRAQGQSPEG
ncbi:hypothetical protein [Phenylobacterium sp.]|uniref:hypothetical protein n=1 Tax=Phenylobacterium sp. TaxID=1871053 RepID=UPI002B537A55|nr:hypothetical protein [Phenylobacterium sp.]HVI31726.1 hypothetical protein [Phenylobacterium sp.]